MVKTLRKISKALACLLILAAVCFSGVIACSSKPTVTPDTTFKFDSNGNYYYSDRAKVIGKTERRKPGSIGSLKRYPVPTKAAIKDATAAEIDAIYAENKAVMDSCAIDIAAGNLKKHVAADGQFYGVLPEDAETVIKEVLIDTRRVGGRTLGHVPAGEVAKIVLPENVSFSAFIGYEEPHFNIPREKYSISAQNRMPTLMKEFALKSGDNYVGTPFGGSLSIFVNAVSIAPFTIRVEGVVENPVFNYGITTNEEWKEIRNLPGLTAEIYTRYARLVMPSSKIRNTDDMNAIGEYWYKAGCLSTYATNQENSRTGPVTLNFDNYVAAGGAVNVGGKFTMQPLGAADYNADPNLLLYNNSWGNMHEFNHSFQYSNGVRWGIESCGEITNNVLSVLSMISYTDIATKRTENAMAFRDDTTDPYNCFKSTMNWYNDPNIKDYSKYWEQGGIHYNYFIFGDIAHAFGVDNAVKFIRSYGDGTCPPLAGFNPNASSAVPETIKINRRDFALRAAKVLGYDMTYYLNTVNKMNFDKSVIDEIKALKLPEFKPAANLYAYGRDDGKTRAQSGRPFFISYGETYDFDFVGKTLAPDTSFVISKEPTAKNGSFKKLENGKYQYTGNGTPENDPFSFKVKFSDGKEIEFFGEIAFNINGINVQAWENININVAGEESLKLAAAFAEKTSPTKTDFYSNGIGVPNNTGNNFHRAEGVFKAPKSGTYSFYAKADDCAMFYLSSDATKEKLNLILTNKANTGGYNENLKSEPQTLVEGKLYYFRFDVLNTQGSGLGQVGYKIDDGNISNVLSKSVYNANLTEAQINEFSSKKTHFLDNQYKSPFTGRNNFTELSKEKVSIVFAPPSTSDTKIGNIIDGKDNNYYYTLANKDRKFILNFNETVRFNSFVLAQHPGNRNADIKKYAIHYSMDGINYTKIMEGDANSVGRIDCIFDYVATQFFMLEVLEGKSSNNLAFAELHFYQRFDTRKGIAGIKNDSFTYSSKPDIETSGVYESNFLTLLKKDMTATTKFNGNNLAIFAVKQSTAGKMEVIIDNVSYGIIDLNSAETKYREFVFLTGALSEGEHTLTLKCTEGVANIDFIQVNSK